MKKLGMLAALLVALTIGLGGCGDDVKKTKRIETVHESDPEPVAPGEMIVE